MGNGGDLISVFIKRQDNETRSFTVPTGGDNSRIMGGRYTEEQESNGDGSTRDIVRSRPGEREVELDINDQLLDHEWLMECSSLPGNATVSYTHINSIVYTHQAKPVGDISKNDARGIATVSFKGTQLKQDV